MIFAHKLTSGKKGGPWVQLRLFLGVVKAVITGNVISAGLSIENDPIYMSKVAASDDIDDSGERTRTSSMVL
eukprot:COSAG02_NODE_3433_length_6750_cov_29.777477_1_plen_72_part_00